MTIAPARPTPDPLPLALMRLAAGVPGVPLPAASDAEVLRLTATPLSALGRLVAPLVGGLRATGQFETLRLETRRALLDRRDAAVRADLVVRRFLSHRLLPAWPAGVQVALVKGAALNGLAYGDDEPRQARDLDLVVAAAHFERALETLEGLGGRVAQIPGRRVSQAHSSERTVRFGGSQPVEVDLHAGFAEPRLFAVADGAVWARSGPWSLDPHPDVRVLGAADALAHLAVHAVTHARLGARSLVDAHRLVARRPIDWASLPGVGAAWGARAPLYLLLLAAGAVLDTPVPPSTLAALEPPAWAMRLGSALLGDGLPGAPAGLPVGLRRVLVLALLDRPGPALRSVPRQAVLRLLDLLDGLRTPS